MPRDTPPTVLIAHPSTPNAAVHRLGVELRVEHPAVFEFRYLLEADMSHVRVPVSGTGSRSDALWRHTCFEAFIAPSQGSGYHEFNFSPSLDWAIYRFSGYREGMSPAEVGQVPEMSVRRHDAGLELRSIVHWAQFPELRGSSQLRIALAAVIEDENGRLSYWGLRHAPGKPDFHHADAFALEVACT